MIYKAKRTDNGKTVCGSLIVRNCEHYYIVPDDEFFVEECHAGAWRLLNLTAFKVEPESVEAAK